MVSNVLSRNKKTGYLIVIALAAAAIIIGLIWWLNIHQPTPAAQLPLEKKESKPIVEVPAGPAIKTATDESLGSGFALTIPPDWTHTHTSAQNPTSTNTIQIDENKVVSPSGKVQVIMRIQTNTPGGGACTNDYIKLKFLSTDVTPKLQDSRFAAYVVQYPRSGLYQYQVGLQKNTEAIRGVSLTSNTACNFMFGEFLERPSSIPGVPVTRTLLTIRFTDVSSDENLQSGMTEQDVASRLSGPEYEQAKQIVQSVYLR